MHSLWRQKKRSYQLWCIFGSTLILAIWRVVHDLHISDNTSLQDVPILENSHSVDNQWMSHHLSRQLQWAALENCTPRAIENFPRDFMTQGQRKRGGVALHIVLVLYMFLGLSLVCDEYFVPSLEVICEYLHMKPDVAGATLMAAGSSAPELATGVIGVFIAKNDIGLGAVVGSAVYNIMFVISVCALLAGYVVYLNWWPLVRDCVFYMLSILVLVLVIIDEAIYWWESLILLGLYAVYIVFMYYNEKLEAWFVARVRCCGPKRPLEENELVIKKNGTQNGTQNGNGAVLDMDSDDLEEVNEYSSSTQALLPSVLQCDNHIDMQVEEMPDVAATVHKQQNGSALKLEKVKVEGDSGIFTPPSGMLGRMMWCISLPLNFLLYITIPDCRREKWRRWVIFSFLMSCLWISAFSYIMVWMITITGFTLGIPETVMGLTFIAAGISVPDVLASVMVVKDGYGDMAVSNAVGSNNFDILICMGLPWFVMTAVYQPGSSIEVYSAGLTYSAITLFSTVFFLLIGVHLNGWKLDKKFGVILMVVYVLYMILATLYELNIFSYVHPPECPSNY